MEPLRLLLLASGRGSHVANLIDATRDGRLRAVVVRVVSDRPDAPALEYARERSIPDVRPHTVAPRIAARS